MIYIKQNPDRILQIAEEWHSTIFNFLNTQGIYYVSYTERSTGAKRKEMCKTYKAKMKTKVKRSKLNKEEKKICIRYINTFCDALRDYVMADEGQLIALHDDYKSAILSPHTEQKINIHNKLSEIFIDLYAEFTTEYAYHFFQLLNIRTCPYCNRNYTFTIQEDKKKTRPEFDHFYDKASYPLLAVSFYNLVPSCHTCNHIKGNDSLLINPYFHGFEGRFKITKEGTFLGYESASKEEKEDMHTLGLNELYREHNDYVQELFLKAQAYSKHAREALVTSFQGAGDSPDKVYDFVWGKNLEDANHINRPLSKLTKDILDQLDIH